MGCQILAGLSCLCSGFVPEAYFWVRMTLALVGKMGASAAFAVVFVYTCELFLDTVAYFLPFVIMGGASVIVGILAFLLPETRGCELPATVEEAMALGTKKKVKETEDQ